MQFKNTKNKKSSYFFIIIKPKKKLLILLNNDINSKNNCLYKTRYHYPKTFKFFRSSASIKRLHSPGF